MQCYQIDLEWFKNTGLKILAFKCLNINYKYTPPTPFSAQKYMNEAILYQLTEFAYTYDSEAMHEATILANLNCPTNIHF